jgi:cation:H+ antiporter
VWWREKEPPKLGEMAEVETHPADTARRPAVALGLAGLGIALMVAGGDIAVRGAVRVVELFDQSDAAIGLTVLALATTAELFALVFAAARHDVPEVAVAGVVGSAAYNATATLGAGALAAPLAVSGLVLPAIAAASLPLLLLVLARDGALRRVGGALLATLYVVYVLIVLL